MKKHIKLLSTLLIVASMLVGCGSTSGTVSYDSASNDYYGGLSADSASMQSTSGITGGFLDSVTSDFNSSNKYESAVESEGYYNKSVDYESKNESIKTEEQVDSEMTLNMEKLVYKCAMSIETMEYQKSYDAIKKALEEVGGIVQYERQTDDSNRWYYESYVKRGGTLHATISCRVPTAKYNEFVNSVGNVGKVMDKQTSVDNISQEYYDTTTKVQSLKIQEERLLTMLQAATTVEEMLNIEDRLESIRYEISKYETKIVYMDMDVAYSYVDIELTEVLEYTQVEEPVKKNTFIDRLVNTIKDSADNFLELCEEVLFSVIYLVPYIIIGAVIFIIICKIRKIKAKDFFKRKKTEEIKDLMKKLDDITK